MKRVDERLARGTRLRAVAVVVALLAATPTPWIPAQELTSGKQAAAKAENPGTVDEFLLKLRDGNVLRAQTKTEAGQAIQLTTSFGETKLKLEQITGIAFDENLKKHRVHMKDGSQISGRLLDKEMTIFTMSDEKISVAWETIESIRRVAPDLKLVAALREIDALKFVNELKVDGTQFPEAKLVLAQAVKRDHSLRKKAEANQGRMPPHPALLKDAKKVELMKIFDPTKAPMRKHAGKAQKTPGAYAPEALVGTTGGIMIWGLYADLEKGRYIAVYRVQYLQNPNGGNLSHFDVCLNANTWKGISPNADEVKGPGEWNEIPVPFETPETKPFEFRFWPHGRQIAHDRIYLFRLE